MKSRILLSAFLLFLYAVPAHAGVESVAHNYVNLFNQAHKDNDEQQKDKYYKLITGNEEILEYVRKEYPTTYTLIRLEKTRRRLDTIKFRMGEETLSSGTGEFRVSDSNEEQSGIKSEKRAGSDNQSLAQDFPNQDRSPNRITSGGSNSGIRSTNRDTVRNFPNQERVRRMSNQKRLQEGR